MCLEYELECMTDDDLSFHFVYHILSLLIISYHIFYFFKITWNLNLYDKILLVMIGCNILKWDRKSSYMHDSILLILVVAATSFLYIFFLKQTLVCNLWVMTWWQPLNATTMETTTPYSIYIIYCLLRKKRKNKNMYPA